MWQSRLQTSHQDVNSFYQRLLVWSAAAEPHQLQDGWLHLSKMCHRRGLTGNARTIIKSIADGGAANDQVEYARMTFDWRDDGDPRRRQQVYDELYNHAVELSHVCGFPAGRLATFDKLSLPNSDLARWVLS